MCMPVEMLVPSRDNKTEAELRHRVVEPCQCLLLQFVVPLLSERPQRVWMDTLVLLHHIVEVLAHLGRSKCILRRGPEDYKGLKLFSCQSHNNLITSCI